MTLLQTAESAGVAGLTGATAAGAVLSADIGGLLAWVVPIGAAIVAGYYSAQISTRSEIADLKASLEHMGRALDRIEKSIGESEHRTRDEMQTYYQRKAGS